MTTDSAARSYKGFRFPAEIIAHTVWLYHRFPLSFRDVEELLFARGIAVTYETILSWRLASSGTMVCASLVPATSYIRLVPGCNWVDWKSQRGLAV
jgi:hypothetical protein